MEIQHIILQKNRIIEEDLLFRIDNEWAMKSTSQGIQVTCNSVITFDTYYNSFSCAKWRKYTRITDIGFRFKFSGKATIEFIYCNNKMERAIQKRIYVDSNQVSDEMLEIGKLQDEGVMYFIVKTMGGFCLYEAGWCSKDFVIDDSVNLGLAICTYKKEQLVKDNLKIICNSLKEKDLMPFNRKIRIFVSDNGKTLDKEDLNNEYITLIPNKNCGGSGGFTRCIIEILEHYQNNSDKFTHVILMDDDAIIEPEVIKRTILFLMCLKEQYKNYCLAGAMLYQEDPCMQHSSGEVWINGIGLRKKANYNLANFEEVVLNEVEEDIDYAGWFYCVIPLTEIEKCGMPLPFFIHCDDIEFGLRQEGRFITLNGINIWHPNFKMKNGSYIKYYDVRNTLILNSIYADKKINTKCHIIKFLIREFVKNIVRYNYTDIKLMLLGVNDFCKGIDWIKRKDAEKRHGELLAEISKLNSVVDIQCDFDLENVNYDIEKNKRFDYVIAMLNWVRPLEKEKIIYHNNIQEIKKFIGKRTVIIVDHECKKGRMYQRNYKNLLELTKMFFETLNIVFASYILKVKEYKDRKEEISNVTFWKEYLEMI